jgi:hypothetical protein
LPRRERLFWLMAGLVLVVGVMSLIPAHYEICKEAEKAQQEGCISYQVVPFAWIKVAQILDKAGVAVTALATIFIAAFTFTLKAATDRLWKAGDEQLKFVRESAIEQAANTEASLAISDKAAAAAERSAKVAEDALFVAQRPYIFVTIAQFREQLNPNTFNYTGPEVWPWIDFQLENHGRTAASIIEICADSACVAKLPAGPVYREQTKYYTPHLVGADKIAAVGYVFKTPIDGKVMNDIAITPGLAKNARRLFAFGYVKYRDIFDYTNTVGFCWRYNRALMAFIPAEEEEGYTYRISEPPTPT